MVLAGGVVREVVRAAGSRGAGSVPVGATWLVPGAVLSAGWAAGASSGRLPRRRGRTGPDGPSGAAAGVVPAVSPDGTAAADRAGAVLVGAVRAAGRDEEGAGAAATADGVPGASGGTRMSCGMSMRTPVPPRAEGR
ncbi:hypothetical protein SHIRM173S_12515 [Streptomyces hirsutus]